MVHNLAGRSSVQTVHSGRKTNRLGCLPWRNWFRRGFEAPNWLNFFNHIKKHLSKLFVTQAITFYTKLIFITNKYQERTQLSIKRIQHPNIDHKFTKYHKLKKKISSQKCLMVIVVWFPFVMQEKYITQIFLCAKSDRTDIFRAHNSPSSTNTNFIQEKKRMNRSQIWKILNEKEKNVERQLFFWIELE